MVSHPSAVRPLQSTWPLTHTAVVHAPDWQVVALVQGVPKAPQWWLSTVVSTSQPLLAIPSQAAKPGAQAMPQPLAPQVGVALGPVGQTMPQPPQEATDARLVSQPASALQSA